MLFKSNFLVFIKFLYNTKIFGKKQVREMWDEESGMRDEERGTNQLFDLIKFVNKPPTISFVLQV